MDFFVGDLGVSFSGSLWRSRRRSRFKITNGVGAGLDSGITRKIGIKSSRSRHQDGGFSFLPYHLTPVHVCVMCDLYGGCSWGNTSMDHGQKNGEERREKREGRGRKRGS